jgi:hypothetical protein
MYKANALSVFLYKEEVYSSYGTSTILFHSFKYAESQHKDLLVFSFVLSKKNQMVLFVSSFRKTHLIETVLLVSSSHIQESYRKAFSFFPYKGKNCKYVFCVFLHEVKFHTDEAFNILFIIGKQLASYGKNHINGCFSF